LGHPVTEGYFVKYRGCIWAVKGCRHPEGFAVAVPRKCGEVKVKKLSDSIALVRLKFPELIRYDPIIGYEVPMVPLRDAEVLDPFEAEVNDPLAREFMGLLKGKVGVTGSLLYDSRHNDMDFLSFDESHYLALRNLREIGITGPLTEAREEEAEALTVDCFKKLKAIRVLEGTFRGTPYTFKIVKCVDEALVLRTSVVEGTFKITGLVKPYSLPVIYAAEGPLKGFLKSYRIRFTELPEGLELRVKAKAFVRENGFIEVNLDTAERVECAQKT
jgi:hypothetical protein